jgi:predicted enzyme related to lactoylglutathione lyase
MHVVASGAAGSVASARRLGRISAACREVPMPRPVHFEMNFENLDRAKEFYGNVFGWSFKKYGDEAMPYWLVTSGPDGEPGINGGFMGRMPGMQPGTVNTMGVESVDKAVETIKAAGGTIAMEKMAVPGMGWVAYAKDPEGSLFGVFEMDSAAA